MKSFIYIMLCLVCTGFISGCAGSSSLKEKHSGYSYNGEKYGKVVVTLSEKVTSDTRKETRIEQMNLEIKLIDQLKTAGLYDESSQNMVSVVIDSIYIRNAFNAIMFGAMAGADNIAGTVTLTKKDVELAIFDVTASYAFGGTAGGQNEPRLEWLSHKFAELTAETILGKN